MISSNIIKKEYFTPGQLGVDKSMDRHIKLSFSGGGFRASFYCLGAYRHLIELGLGNIVTHISSVSGGSITAGVIMCALTDSPFKSLSDFDQRVSTPLKQLGQLNLRNQLFRTAFSPFQLRNYVPEGLRTRFSRIFPELLDKHIFKNKLMKDLTCIPEWSCNATCLNTLKRFRFKSTDMYGFQLGYCEDIGDISVALAVASSAAFPLMFAPIRLNVKGRHFDGIYSSEKLKYNTLFLTDGGVYDNLGSENLLKEKVPFIILDASAASLPWRDGFNPRFHNMIWRTLSVSMDQIVQLRRRLIYHQANNESIQLLLNKNIAELVNLETELRKPEKPFPFFSSPSSEIESLIADLRTDLDYFHEIEIDMLMWAGAVRMDLAVKSLCPDLIDEGTWTNTPIPPNYLKESIISKLKEGQKRKVFRISK